MIGFPPSILFVCCRLLFFLSFGLFQCVHAENIELAECEPPDYPEFGGYGPKQDFYIPGDTIHYFCDTDTYIGGHYFRLCLDSGGWSGDTPVCDSPALFDEVWQTSTAEPTYKNEADSASDGSRDTCSETETGADVAWTATLQEVSTVLRVMVFLPKGEAAYEVFIVRPDGSEVSCGGKHKTIELYEWNYHHCREPRNTGMVSVKIRSKSLDIPLRLCEVVVHVTTNPTCHDPRITVENGHLMLSRKKAVLVCDKGYTKDRDSTIQCIRKNVWSRKMMHCTDIQREVETVDGSPIQGERPDV